MSNNRSVIEKNTSSLFSKTTPDEREDPEVEEIEKEEAPKKPVVKKKTIEKKDKPEPEIEKKEEKLTQDLRILIKPSEKTRAQKFVDNPFSEYDNLSELARVAISKLLDVEEPLVELVEKEVMKAKKKLNRS